MYVRNPSKRMKCGRIKLPKDIVMIVKVTLAVHGYDGWMGLLIGHYLLGPTRAMTFAKPVVEDEEAELEKLLLEASGGDTATAATALQKWRNKRSKGRHSEGGTRRPSVIGTRDSKSLSSVSVSLGAREVSKTNWLAATPLAVGMDSSSAHSFAIIVTG